MTHRENRIAATANHNRHVLAMPIRGQPRITIAACNEAGCRVTEIVEHRRSLIARRAEHASLKSGGRLSHNNVLWFLHWRPPTMRKNTGKEDMLTRRFLRGFLLKILSSPARQSATFFEQAIRLFWAEV